MCTTGSRNSGHTAITSWSGYLYQGKIAIFHALKLLIEKTDISDYSLRLDCEEDFDILKNGVEESLHQVKGKGSDLFSAYSSAFGDIKLKSSQYPQCSLYFHTALSIRDKSKEDIEQDYSPVKVYSYSDDKYHCGLNEVDELIERKIKEYLTQKGAGNYKIQDNYLSQIREKLDDLVLKKVLFIHYKNMMGEGLAYKLAEDNPIRLSEIQSIIESDSVSDWIDSEDYILFLAKYALNKHLETFLQNKEVDLETEERLKKYLIHICGLTNDEMKKFVKSLIPHTSVSFCNLRDYVSGNLQGDDLKYAFYEILSGISQDLKMDNEKIYWLDMDLSFYTPTAINRSGKIQKIQTCKDIVRNIEGTDLDVGFEFQNMITSELDTPSIYATANNTNSVDEKTEDNTFVFDANDSKRITRWKTVSLISLEKAEKKICNE